MSCIPFKFRFRFSSVHCNLEIEWRFRSLRGYSEMLYARWSFSRFPMTGLTEVVSLFKVQDLFWNNDNRRKRSMSIALSPSRLHCEWRIRHSKGAYSQRSPHMCRWGNNEFAYSYLYTTHCLLIEGRDWLSCVSLTCSVRLTFWLYSIITINSRFQLFTVFSMKENVLPTAHTSILNCQCVFACFVGPMPERLRQQQSKPQTPVVHCAVI